MKSIWVIFSVENNYDQPPHNLFWWGTEKPSFEKILSILGLSATIDTQVIEAVSILNGNDTRLKSHNTDYLLKEITEGIVSND